MKVLTNMDFSKNEIQNAVVQNLASAPPNPKEGQFYYDSTDETLYVYAGGEWTDALFHFQLTKDAIKAALGFLPREIQVGNDTEKGTATGSKILYIATDTKKIWLDHVAGTWLQVGGQDTISWSNITGKPSVFPPPVATKTRLGGIKVGENLTITEDGTLSAVTTGGDGTNVYLVKQQVFTATEGQTAFTITNGKYRTGAGLLSVFLDGIKVRSDALKETGNTSFQLLAGVPAGTQVLAEYVQIMDADPYLSHGIEHTEGGADAIPNATGQKGGLLSAADKAKLDGIAAGANKYTHPSGDGNQHVPATGTTNNGKLLQAGATAGSMQWVAPTKAMVGLGNVDNTSDANKPVSTAQQTALDKKLDKTLKGATNGLAELDGTGKVPAAQLPSYVDDILEGYLSGGKFYKESAHTTVINGEAGKIYVDLPSNKTYRWSGSAFVVISETLALGETSSTAYRGDHGKIAYDHSQKTHARTDATKTEDSGTNGNIKINGEEVNVYTHPSNHPASMITPDATHRFVTDSEKASWNSRVKKYAADIGNGTATEFTVTHNLGTQDVTVLLREKISPFNQVFCDIQILSATQIKLLFAVAPAAGAYRVVVTG
ncbi:MAG: hypothetical protein Q4C97_04100 [Bacillota bacterium]|nr:hypothetical protein [Bacillota bacterium]